MRLENKYKKFANLNTSTLSFPKRILKFKRSKWKNCQKRISIDSKTLQILNNPLIYKLSPRSVENVNNYYKDGLTLKNFLILFFDNSFNERLFIGVNGLTILLLGLYPTTLMMLCSASFK